MKRGILLVILFCTAIRVKAQPVITSAQLLTTFIDTVSFLQPEGIGPGPAGAGVTWDFSSLPSSTTKNAVKAGDCPDNPICSAIPAANTYSKHTFLISNTFSVSAASKTALKLETIGAQNDSEAPFTFTDPKTEFVFPVSYNQTYTDHYAWTNAGSSSRGEVDYLIDGYGTVTTPMGTFTNVLRKKMVQKDTSTSAGFTVTSTSTVYTWLRAGQPGLILYYLESTVLTPVAQPTQYSLVYGDNPPAVITGIDNTNIEEQLIDVYPNPVTGDHIRIRTTQKITQLKLTDITGRILYQKDTDSRNGQQNYIVPISGQVAGLYLLTITTDIGMLVKKVILTK